MTKRRTGTHAPDLRVPGRTLSFDFTNPAPARAESAEQRPTEAAEPVQTEAKARVAAAGAPSAKPVVPVVPVAAPTTAPLAAPASKAPADEKPRALTVGELDRAIKRHLDGGFVDPVWVEGEVVGARAQGTGHLYFCLRDEKEEAVIDVAMYKGNITPRTRAIVKDGARVRLRGKPSFWAPRGKLQFVAERAEIAGKGALLEALEKLKQKLAAEGLFAPERKRKLPTEPRIVGVVTSATGAVIHDICKVAFRRGSGRILLAPAIVQGASAAESICKAIALLQRVAEVDVIIVGRGGGSSDDLACFNDEAVVRAVAACPVPVVSAVGHEVDVTLTDFAADARAATPSQAAEMVVPDLGARRQLLREREQRLLRSLRTRLSHEHRVQADLARRMGDPRLAIASSQQLLDDRVARLTSWSSRVTTRARALVVENESRLARMHPRLVIQRERAGVEKDEQRLRTVMTQRLRGSSHELHQLGGRLNAMSPLNVLGRGYAIARTHDNERAVRDAKDVAIGDRISIRVHSAKITADVVAVEALSDADEA